MNRFFRDIVPLGMVMFIFLLMVLIGFSGGTETEIYYKNQLRPISQVEEIIADELEIENPELDLEVNIREEIED